MYSNDGREGSALYQISGALITITICFGLAFGIS